MKTLKQYLSVAMLLCVTLNFTACNDNTDIPDAVYGTWSDEIASTASNGHKNVQTLVLTLSHNGTGIMSYSSNVYYRAYNFSFTMKGEKIKCTGVVVGEDLNVNTNWAQTFQYHGTYITPNGAYSQFKLRKNV